MNCFLQLSVDRQVKQALTLPTLRKYKIQNEFKQQKLFNKSQNKANFNSIQSQKENDYLLKRNSSFQQVFSEDSKDIQQASASTHQFNFVVIGSGIAGLSYALKVSKYGSVAVITKGEAQEGNTRYAQGGISAVLDPLEDSIDKHVQDTMIAGGYLNDQRAVEIVCSEGPERVLELATMGSKFDKQADGKYHLTREGGHSSRRVIHAKDATGKEVERTLFKAARNSANITFFENHQAVDLVIEEYQGTRYCLGVDVINQNTQQSSRFLGLSTMLCTGGAGQVYPNTTNPSVATGDGVAMAFRAEATISNMEFIQFHPTGFYQADTGADRRPLISEAVRGEGGILLNMAGERFMEKYDDRLELAPRDVVARSIYDQMMKRNEPHALLDISHKGRAYIMEEFPNIYQICLDNGVDMAVEPIPVIPTQHYTCGGVQTDYLGESSIKGLFACGEVAHSGLHGANRLASNSLLEGLVFAHRAVDTSVVHAEHVLRDCQRQFSNVANNSRNINTLTPLPGFGMDYVNQKKKELREVMWKGCGIVRNIKDLEEATQQLSGIKGQLDSFREQYGTSSGIIEVQNLVTVGQVIAESALSRRESRGGHYLEEHPSPRDIFKRPTVVGAKSNIRKSKSLKDLQVLVF